MRIDAHVHYTPPTMAADMPALAHDEPFWGLLLAPERSGAAQDWAEPERMIEDMDAAGLDKVVIQGSYWQKHETSVARNSEVMELVQRWPDRIMGFATLQPKAGPPALDELKRCLDGGLSGVGELGAYGQGYSLEDADFLRLVEACIEHSIPLNLHVNEEVGHFYPGKGSTRLIAYYRLAQRYPELKLILAHWGGGLCFYELMPEVARVLANTWYDTAASPLLFPTPAIFAAALAAIDYRKILYASDYPLRICPRKQRGPDFRPFLAEIDALELQPEVYADIIGENAARLLGLAPGEPRIVQPAQQSRTTVVTEIAPGALPAIDGLTAVRAVAEAWPATRAVLDAYRIPWQEGAAPFWEPIAQAAAARGWDAVARAHLIDELNAAAAGGPPSRPPVEGAGLGT